MMTIHMNKTLRFWVECALETDGNGHGEEKQVAHVLQEFEEAGDAMRYVRADGKIGWKATPDMLTKLRDARRDAEDESDDD
jgi:hypothetical protein